MSHRLYSGIAILLFGIAVGATLISTHGRLESQQANSHSPADRLDPVSKLSEESAELSQYIEVLEEELNHYRDWAFQLENQLIVLERRLEGVEAAVNAPEPTGTARVEQAKPSGDASQAPTGILTAAALIDNGLDPQLAAELIRRRNQIDMQRLELRDQAIRDGTFGKKEYFQALRELNETTPSLRSEIGDKAYDRYLYSLGQSNRVIVRSVIPGSPAEQAGIQQGDIILAYHDTRIFNHSELKSATAEGERGEYILIDIRRDGGRLSLPLPRGPLGIRMGDIRYRPTDN